MSRKPPKNSIKKTPLVTNRFVTGEKIFEKNLQLKRFALIENFEVKWFALNPEVFRKFGTSFNESHQNFLTDIFAFCPKRKHYYEIFPQQKKMINARVWEFHATNLFQSLMNVVYKKKLIFRNKRVFMRAVESSIEEAVPLFFLFNVLGYADFILVKKHEPLSPFKLETNLRPS